MSAELNSIETTRRSPRSSVFLAVWLLLSQYAASADNLPDGFVYVESIVPTIRTEMRYFTADNFTGRPVDGYEGPVCIMTTQAALALREVQDELLPFGLGLKIFDAYRPQRAVDRFVKWAADPADQINRDQYYPEVPKKDLLALGYIASRSGHSRGSTVDVTIVALDETAGELDMGTTWDWFGPRSWPSSLAATPGQRAYRMLLQTLMVKHGFKPLREEWWHFTLVVEPYADTYFDFPVR